ncbi:MAG: phytanoyl-CoA dioxygenase family protein [Xanthomonadales bacterium]|nr:phytanoyl-CoA dioxygenase family protein [Xanthomonadales bacterium]
MMDPSPDLRRWLGERTFEDWRDEFDERGYVIFENVLSAERLGALRNALAPHLEADQRGRNEFEGRRSNRVYGMLAKSPLFAELVIHPLALAFVEADLGPSCLLSACLAINLQPGETVQPWHYDEAHIDLPRPRRSSHVSTFWAIDAMTEDNGATEVLPGSHRWSDEQSPLPLTEEDFDRNHVRSDEGDPGAHPDTVKVAVPPGSLMIAKGTLWHRGGANRSDQPRLIITPQYCAGWARQLENQVLAVPPDIAAGLPARAQQLLGYSIHPPFMGYVNGVHPRRLLS